MMATQASSPAKLAPEAKCLGDEPRSEPVGKKARLSQHSPNVAEVLAALPEAVASLQQSWSASLSELLLATVPAALETARDRRCRSQLASLQLAGEILESAEAGSQTRLHDVRADVETAAAVQAEREAAVESAKSESEAQEEIERSALLALGAGSEALATAAAELKERLQELLNHELTSCASSMKRSLDKLKAGSWTSDHDKQECIQQLLAVFGKIHGVGKQLLDTLPIILPRELCERGDFDWKVLEQVDETLKKHRDELIAQLQQLPEGIRTEPALQEASLQDAQVILERAEHLRIAEEGRSVLIECLRDGPPADGFSEKQLIALTGCSQVGIAEAVREAVLTAADKRSDAELRVLREFEQTLQDRLRMLEQQLQSVQPCCQSLTLLLENMTASMDAQEQSRRDSRKHLVKDKEMLLTAQTKRFNVLRAGSWDTPLARASHIRSLTAIMKKLNADSSMVTALPPALKKIPEERGDFDNAVVTQLGEMLSERIAYLEGQIASLEREEGNEDQKVVAAARRARLMFEVAEAQRFEAAQRATAAAEQRRKAEASLTEARQRVEQQAEELAKRKDKLSELTAALTQLCRARESFSLLRDQCSEDAA